MQQIFYVTVKVTVDSNLDIDDTMEEFNSETKYTFSHTEHVTVTDTKIMEIDIQY